MKKVPHWIQKVIFASQHVWCADARNQLLNNMIEGNFDYLQFDRWCRYTYNIKVEGRPTTADSYSKAIKQCDKNFEPINIQRLINQAGL